MSFTWPSPWTTAAQELVVPRSMPTMVLGPSSPMRGERTTGLPGSRRFPGRRSGRHGAVVAGLVEGLRAALPELDLDPGEVLPLDRDHLVAAAALGLEAVPVQVGADG